MQSDQRNNFDHFDKLSQRFSMLEAQTRRLNILSAYIAKKTNINIEPFDLSHNPAMGGVIGRYIEPRAENLSEKELIKSIKQSEYLLSKQKRSLNKYSKFKLAPLYQSPVKSGYISSRYGMRTDPITGKRTFHKGLDIASKIGEKIYTIGSGFVTFAGRKKGYGNVIEIQHSDSLKSRYAHLNRLFVKKGDVILKGKKIATMGNTGRVTGPHLHIEIWKKGKAINPQTFFKLSLRKL